MTIKNLKYLNLLLTVVLLVLISMHMDSLVRKFFIEAIVVVSLLYFRKQMLESQQEISHSSHKTSK